MTPLQRKILKPALKFIKDPGETFVFVSIEYGYQYKMWFPQISGCELERRWKAARDMDYQHSSMWKLLKTGVWFDAYFRKEAGVECNDWESFDRSIVPKTFYEAGDQGARINDIVSSRGGNGFYTAHIFTDDDSFLKTPNGQIIRHSTYWQSKIESEKRIQEMVNA